MARPYKHATPICLVLTAIAAIGVVIGIMTRQPIVVIIGLLPTAVYEAYRTMGESTRWASWLLVVVRVGVDEGRRCIP